MSGPPDALVRSLVDEPSVVSGVEWHPETPSTNALAAEAARRREPEVYAVLTDLQTAGRGRLGRSWQAPAGTSLLMSLLTRPPVATSDLPLLSLLTGVALADAVRPHCPGATVELKWPNDLLVDGRKAAGILVERGPDDAVIVGCGVNVDWRTAPRPDELSGASSLSEAAGVAIDRWCLLACFLKEFGGRYRGWCGAPRHFLDDYRALCATVGRQVRVTRRAAPALVGVATGIADDGALLVATASGTERVAAGDVEHVRPLSRPRTPRS